MEIEFVNNQCNWIHLFCFQIEFVGNFIRSAILFMKFYRKIINFLFLMLLVKSAKKIMEIFQILHQLKIWTELNANMVLKNRRNRNGMNATSATNRSTSHPNCYHIKRQFIVKIVHQKNVFIRKYTTLKRILVYAKEIWNVCIFASHSAAGKKCWIALDIFAVSISLINRYSISVMLQSYWNWDALQFRLTLCKSAFSYQFLRNLRWYFIIAPWLFYKIAEKVLLL